MLPAGQRGRRIRVERAIKGDDGLAVTETWTLFAELWAEKLDVSDGERVRAAEVGAEVTTRWRLLRNSLSATITPRDRIVYRGTIYNISGIKEIGREGFEITSAARTDLDD